ncbi:MAG: hypothetical protein E7396_01025 [Ruminococcaceae bacterium]|nr:hypothetical protein [Oscillospiraceae bacterium]
MKRIVSVLLVVFLLITSLCVTSFAEDSVKVVINGVEQTYDQMPVIVNGRTLVPMRGIFEALGARVQWIDYSKTVVGSRDRKFIKLKLGSDEVAIDGVSQKIDVPAQIINSRTMVPVRFISEALGEKVEWDGNTKTVYITSEYIDNVAISDKLAHLPSTMHRPVPTEFKRSNSLDDLDYFETKSTVDDDYLSYIVTKPTTIVEPEYFLTMGTFGKDGNIITSDTFGSAEVVDVSKENIGVNKALRVVTSEVPASSSSHCWSLGQPIKDKYKEGDNVLVAFKARLTEGGVAGNGTIYTQIQEITSGKWRKLNFQKINIPSEWVDIYIPLVMKDGFDDVAVRFGYCDAPQTVEIANFRILNYGPEIAGDYKLPSFDGFLTKELEKDAPWRQEALKKIEQVRKGDFKVVVKDENGNPIPDAKVTFDMFESAFPLGTAISSWISTDEKKMEQFNSWFNGSVIEHAMKWGPYEANMAAGQNGARMQLEGAKKLGSIYNRGHVFIFDYPVTPSGTVLLPEDLVTNMKNKDFCDLRIRGWIDQLSDDFAGEFKQWDVFNETFGHTTEGESIYGTYGADYYKEIADWARAANPESELMLVDGANIYSYYERWKNEIATPTFKAGADLDGVGLQSHFGGTYYSPEFSNMIYDYIVNELNADISITEYTVTSTDVNYVANFTRDFFINAFANEHIKGIWLWKWFQSSSYMSPVMTDINGNMLPAGEVILDLYYNKWWTRNAQATTDASGEGKVNGYYGNYDVKVEANGKTKTVMAAFHKGYDNVLEITVK